MGKRKKKVRLPTQKRRVDLNNVGETSGTKETEPSQKPKRPVGEPVDPPFKGEEKKGLVLPDVVVQYGKMALGALTIIGILFGLFDYVATLSWRASELNSDVDKLQTDMIKVIDKTKVLVDNSSKHSNQINRLEESVDNMKNSLQKKSKSTSK